MEPHELLWITAPNCAACHAMRPQIVALAARHPHVRVTELDARDAGVSGLRVYATPTLIGRIAGDEAFRVTGRRSDGELDGLVRSLIERGAPPSVHGRADALIRLGGGGAVVAVGLAAGPAWPLVVFGAIMLSYGAFTLWGTF